MAQLTKKEKEAFVQYSKKMCTRVTIFWMIYRIINFGVSIIRPDIAKYLVDLSTGIDTVMIINMSLYTGNSISEKGFKSFFNRKSIYSDSKESSEDDNDNNNNQEDSDLSNNG